MIQDYFNKSVIVQVATKGISTATGENTETWSTGTTIRASVRPLSMDRQFIQNKSAALVTHRLYSTYAPGMYDRVVFEGKNYEVLAVIDPMSMGRVYQVDMRYVG